MYQTIVPPNHLRKYIDCFWLGDDGDLPGKINSHHSIANSKMEMLFFCQGIYASRDKNEHTHKVFESGFYGQTTHFNHYFSCSKRTIIFGIRFLPLAALTLFEMPANELTSQSGEAELILGKDGTKLIDAVLEAKTFEHKAKAAIEFFEKKLKPLDKKFNNVEKALCKMKVVDYFTPSQIATESCLSSRQFERHFLQLTGFSAKTFLKLHRFEKTVEAGIFSLRNSKANFTDLALEYGYYDQAHFNRHFKEFTGVNPNTYFSNIHLPSDS